MAKRQKSGKGKGESNKAKRGMPAERFFSPDAYAQMDEDAQTELLFEYLDDLDERLCWVDDEMTRRGFCAICVMAKGRPFDHDCFKGDRA
jgi:hypothetical protein